MENDPTLMDVHRISAYVQESLGDYGEAIREYQDYIMGETLTLELKSGAPPGEAATGNFEFDGEQASVGLVKA